MIRIYKYVVLYLLLGGIASFGQDISSLNAADQAALRSSLGTRDPATLSDAEIEAAKAMMQSRSQGQQQKAPVTSKQNLQPVPDSLANPWNDSTLFKVDSLQAAQDSNVFERYENRLFKRALPSAFLERQYAVTAEYPIKAGDDLVLTLWGAVEKEYSFKVNSQGKVNVEGVGLISLNGLNIGQAEKLLTTKLKNVHSGIGMGRIQVNLRVEALAPTKIFVMGDVNQPGGYDLPGNANVFLALYKAKGPSNIGSVRNIKIIRSTGDSVVVDLYDYLFYGKKIDAAILRDGDVVLLPRAEKLVRVKGDLGREAIFELKGTEGLKEALFFAGNPNKTAANNLILWRIMEDGRYDVQNLGEIAPFLTGKSKFELQDLDSLFVSSSTKLPRVYVDVQGMVWYPGMYPFSADVTLKSAIDLAGGLRPEAYADRIVVKRLNSDSSFSYFSDSYSSPKFKLQEQDQIIVLNQSTLKTTQMVSVSGAVKTPTTIEWKEGITAKTLIALAGGFDKNHLPGTLRVERLQKGKDQVTVFNETITNDLISNNGNDPILEPGDRVVIPVDPNSYDQEVVNITGAVRNPGAYSLIKARENFKEFMERVATLDINAFTQGGRLFRKRGKEVYQINFDMKEALSGKLGANIALQGGDSIFIPKEQLTVRITGEVVSPGDVLWSEGMNIEEYIDAAGGFTINGDEDRTIVTYADGRKATLSRASRDPDPGSVIFVSYKKEPEPTNWTTVWAGVTAIVGATSSIIIMYLMITGKASVSN